MLVAAAGWMNFPKRVPVLANPQEGSSIASLSRAFQMISTALSFITRSPFRRPKQQESVESNYDYYHSSEPGHVTRSARPSGQPLVRLHLSMSPDFAGGPPFGWRNFRSLRSRQSRE